MSEAACVTPSLERRQDLASASHFRLAHPAPSPMAPQRASPKTMRNSHGTSPISSPQLLLERGIRELEELRGLAASIARALKKELMAAQLSLASAESDEDQALKYYYCDDDDEDYDYWLYQLEVQVDAATRKRDALIVQHKDAVLKADHYASLVAVRKTRLRELLTVATPRASGCAGLPAYASAASPDVATSSGRLHDTSLSSTRKGGGVRRAAVTPTASDVTGRLLETPSSEQRLRSVEEALTPMRSNLHELSASSKRAEERELRMEDTLQKLLKHAEQREPSRRNSTTGMTASVSSTRKGGADGTAVTPPAVPEAVSKGRYTASPSAASPSAATAAVDTPRRHLFDSSLSSTRKGGVASLSATPVRQPPAVVTPLPEASTPLRASDCDADAECSESSDEESSVEDRHDSASDSLDHSVSYDCAGISIHVGGRDVERYAGPDVDIPPYRPPDGFEDTVREAFDRGGFRSLDYGAVRDQCVAHYYTEQSAETESHGHSDDEQPSDAEPPEPEPPPADSGHADDSDDSDESDDYAKRYCDCYSESDINELYAVDYVDDYPDTEPEPEPPPSDDDSDDEPGYY